MLRAELISHMEDLGAGAQFTQGLSRRIEMVQGDIRHYEDKVRRRRGAAVEMAWVCLFVVC